jgi:hypothetical protein
MMPEGCFKRSTGSLASSVGSAIDQTQDWIPRSARRLRPRIPPDKSEFESEMGGKGRAGGKAGGGIRNLGSFIEIGSRGGGERGEGRGDGGLGLSVERGGGDACARERRRRCVCFVVGVGLTGNRRSQRRLRLYRRSEVTFCGRSERAVLRLSRWLLC